MNYTDRKTANAIGGKTARACDSCLLKRARWYCAADEAFLCQGCDSLVHSANQLASRHQRVRLEITPNKPSQSKTLDNNSVPAWHQGFTRKARTRRHPKPAQKDKERSANICASPLVPDLGTEDALFEEVEAQLLYRVPVFDSFAAELCNVPNESENIHTDYRNEPIIQNNEAYVLFSDIRNDDLDNLPVFPPSDMELNEFAHADVETLLGTGLDEESCGIEGLGLIDCKEENDIDDCYEGSRVKTEDDEEVKAIIACHFDPGLDLSRETLDWNFDYESPVTGEEEEEEKVVVVEAEAEMMDGESNEMRKKKFLRLNYEEVIVAWDNQGCPWTSGIRPEFNPDDCWPDFMGMNAPSTYHPFGSSGRRMGYCGGDDGREARVSRYREKRRTRLFSKKIRYEVRKLNAEKRPRMKGRFVKRTSFAGGSTIPSYLMNK